MPKFIVSHHDCKKHEYVEKEVTAGNSHDAVAQVSDFPVIPSIFHRRGSQSLENTQGQSFNVHKKDE
jgi:hypothetical protein